MSGDRKVFVGSRKSELALIQTSHVIQLLKKYHPHKDFEIVKMTTMGDKVLDIPLPKIGEKSLFTKELEAALSTGCVDFVVHSLKDLPTTLPDGMAIGAVLIREDPRDALVLRNDVKSHTLTTLPKDSVIGTSSLRRSAQLSKKYPHLKIESIRGNLNTRLRKLDELDKFHGIVLAAAGLHRMGWHHRISKILEVDELLYAVGQGALAVECRENDAETLALLKPLFDVETAINITAERSFLKTLGGGCSAPVAVTSTMTNLETEKKNITLKGAVWSLDGKQEIIDEETCLVSLKIPKRCKECPYNQTGNNVEQCPALCGMKRSNASADSLYSKDEIKKMKTESSNGSTDILKDDPHEHCPVQLPVGVDFMGKCPYLEHHEGRKCPVNAEIQGTSNFDITKCPYMKDGNLLDITTSKNNITGQDNNYIISEKQTQLYCGLVPHPEVPKSVLQEAENLGVQLANKIINKGALEIMAKAQASIRNS